MPSTLRRGYIRTTTRRRPSPFTCTSASLCDGDRYLHLTTSTVGTIPPHEGGVGRSKSDADADADADTNVDTDTDEDGEVIEGGDLGEDE